MLSVPHRFDSILLVEKLTMTSVTIEMSREENVT